MPVTNELALPETEERFGEMCFHLYRMEWKDPGCTRLGGVGQGQFGLDSQSRTGLRFDSGMENEARRWRRDQP